MQFVSNVPPRKNESIKLYAIMCARVKKMYTNLPIAYSRNCSDQHNGGGGPFPWKTTGIKSGALVKICLSLLCCCDKNRRMDSQFLQQVHREYVDSQVLAAHPTERVYLLYTVAIDNVRLAIERLKDGDIYARGRAVNKAHEAVDELNFALDHSVGAAFTRTLADLYIYIQRQLVEGHTKKSEQAFQDALAVLLTLADTWREVVVRVCGSSSSVLNPNSSAANPNPSPVNLNSSVGSVNSSVDNPKKDVQEIEMAERGAGTSRSGSEPLAAYGEAPGTVTSRDWSG